MELIFTKEDYYFMEIALEEAKLAYKEEEVPVWAVLVSPDSKLLVKAYNQIIKLNDPTAHSEILALKEGAKKLGNFRLIGCKLYVTLEPCPMCSYAIVLARLEEIIFATPDPKAGGVISLYSIFIRQKTKPSG